MSNTYAAPSPWKSPLFDCFSNLEDALCGCCCAPCLFGRTKARQQDPSLSNFSYVNVPCVTFTVAAYFGVSGLLQFFNRDEMRKTYAIEGSGLKDCLISCCCSCCALVQEEKEVKLRATHAVPEAYVSGSDMKYELPK